MHTKFRTFQAKHLQIVLLGILCMSGSFAIGIRTAGDVQTIEQSMAGSVAAGDINGDSAVDLHDVISILEITQGYQVASPQELLADPNGDGNLTVDDALRLLRDLARS